MPSVLEVCSSTQSDLLALSEVPLESRGNLENWVPAYICTWHNFATYENRCVLYSK